MKSIQNHPLSSLSKTRRLTEAAILLAIATVLSLLKLAELPYGGSITAASMLPLVILAYRHGTPTGLLAGLVYGVIQQLLGLNTLSYVTTWQSILAVILLDYVIAFAVIGLAGLFAKASMPQGRAILFGCLLAGAARYACHVISGATVWAGLSIPDSAALLYSFIYNATYMIPETIVLVLAGQYIGSALDLKKAIPSRRKVEKAEGGRMVSWLSLLGKLLLLAALAYDISEIFDHLQNPESGEFYLSGIGDIAIWPMCIVTVTATVFCLLLHGIDRQRQKKIN